MQSQFSYAPLVWMMHSKLAERKINKTHEKFLRLLHDDYQSNFKELLDKEGTYTVHEMNMKKFYKEIPEFHPPITVHVDLKRKFGELETFSELILSFRGYTSSLLKAARMPKFDAARTK